MNHCVCEDCMENYELEKSDGTPFFTVMGGIIGGSAGLITGTLLLVPASLLGGFVLDVARCERCGSTKNVHEPLMETDRRGIKTYIRGPFRRYDNRERLDEPTTLEETSKQYVYDELEGRFTLIEHTGDLIDTPQMDIVAPDFIADYEVSFDAPDISSEVGSLDSDTGGFGEGSDSGGSASGGGTGGGE